MFVGEIAVGLSVGVAGPSVGISGVGALQAPTNSITTSAGGNTRFTIYEYITITMENKPVGPAVHESSPANPITES